MKGDGIGGGCLLKETCQDGNCPCRLPHCSVLCDALVYVLFDLQLIVVLVWWGYDHYLTLLWERVNEKKDCGTLFVYQNIFEEIPI